MEFVRITINIEYAIFVNVIFFDLKQLLRSLYKINNSIFFFAVGVGIPHKIIRQILLQIFRKPLFKFLNEVDPPSFAFDLGHSENPLIRHIWMQLRIIIQIPYRRHILRRHINTQKQIKHSLFRRICYYVVEMPFDADDHFADFFLFAHAGVVRNRPTILHRYRITHLIIHFKHQIKKLRFHLYLWIF